MADSEFELAQVNLARLVAPLTDPLLAEFVANLEPVNALADRAPGFVWRFQTDDGDATSIRPFDDDRILINFSVWKDLASLRDFVYGGGHNVVMKRRREWFEHMADAYLALWWIPSGHRPTVAEAAERVDHLKRSGPSPHAFTFRDPYPSPNAAVATVSTGR
jgi:hypothetical protein